MGWTSRRNLEYHFNPDPDRKHGAQLGYTNIRDYARGARENMNAFGTIGGYARNGNLSRGYFNIYTGRFTLVNENGRIITYFIPRTGIRYFNNQFE